MNKEELMEEIENPVFAGIVQDHNDLENRALDGSHPVWIKKVEAKWASAIAKILAKAGDLDVALVPLKKTQEFWVVGFISEDGTSEGEIKKALKNF
jgi:hypothetical protein